MPKSFIKYEHQNEDWSMNFKEKVQDQQYKFWLKLNKKCVFCGKDSSYPHHLHNNLDMSRRSRDDYQIPICLDCHLKIHQKPEMENMDLERLQSIAQKYWKEYKAEKGD